ncbi:MAG TPA: hypothetical protein VH137_06350 [Gemmatimonadales bacterium]|nr:hypothetical protein [Gemmatimonadales bacterium]
MTSTETDALVAAWCAHDDRSAVLPADHEVIEMSRSVRAMIADLAREAGADEELYDACAALGRLIASGGGSPTLASQTIDHAGEALGARGAPWLPAARGAVIEGFACTILERAREDAMHSWDFPKCVVSLSETRIAIAAGHPSDDPELLAEWAATIAKAAALQGVRRAFVSGPDPARTSVEDALAVVGIQLDRRL